MSQLFSHCFTPSSHFYLKDNIVWDLLFINFAILSCWHFCQEHNIYFNPAMVELNFHSPLYIYAPRVSLLTSWLITDLHYCKSKENLTLNMQILYYPSHLPDRPWFPFFSIYGFSGSFLKIKRDFFYHFFIFGDESGLK